MKAKEVIEGEQWPYTKEENEEHDRIERELLKKHFAKHPEKFVFLVIEDEKETAPPANSPRR